jgi:hypothetical protein
VYSLSSRGADGGTPTLNIVTYASPIAIKPARKYAVGLYAGTLSWQNVRATGRGVLQVRAVRARARARARTPPVRREHCRLRGCGTL